MSNNRALTLLVIAQPRGGGVAPILMMVLLLHLGMLKVMLMCTWMVVMMPWG